MFNNDEDDSVILAQSRNFSQVSSSVPGLNIFANQLGLGGPTKMGGAAVTPQPPMFVYGTIKYDLSTLDINCVSLDIELKGDIQLYQNLTSRRSVDTTILAKQFGAINVTGSSSLKTVKNPQRPMRKEEIKPKDKAIFICIECDQDMRK